MAKNNNLTDFLTDVANAIREKKGSSDPINPQNFSDEIASIETGGGGGAAVVTENDVNFRDYDGTILHSYSKNEFLALSELPELPSQKGLICQGWNYSYDDAKAYVADYGVLEVGASYITEDGATRLYITIPKKELAQIYLYFNQSIANGVLIDWGDGTSVTTSKNSGNVSAAHTYEAEGSYVISLKAEAGCTMFLGRNSSSYSVLGPNGSSGYVVKNALLHKVEIGETITKIGNYAFKDCTSLKYVTIPNNIVENGESVFYNCSSLKALVFPLRMESIASSCAYGCYNLEAVVLPNGLTSIGNSAFAETSVRTVTIPNSVTSIGSNSFYSSFMPKHLIIPKSIKTIDLSAFAASRDLERLEVYATQLTTSSFIFKGSIKLQNVVFHNSQETAESSLFEECRALQSCILPKGIMSLKSSFFYNCKALTTIDIPEGVKEIGSSCFSGCYALSIVTLPSTLTTISSNAFQYAAGLSFMDCRKCTSVPTLASAFPTLQSWMKIIVPDTLYDNWVVATNWSAVAKYIVKASEYTE